MKGAWLARREEFQNVGGPGRGEELHDTITAGLGSTQRRAQIQNRKIRHIFTKKILFGNGRLVCSENSIPLAWPGPHM